MEPTPPKSEAEWLAELALPEPPLRADPDDPPDRPVRRGIRFYRSGWFWFLMGLLVAVTVASVVTRRVSDDTAPAVHTVVYRVTGDAPADLSYYTGNGTGRAVTKSATNRTLPWTYQLRVLGTFAGFGVTATFHDLNHRGALECTIVVDGTVVSTDRVAAANAASAVGCDGTGYRGSP